MSVAAESPLLPVQRSNPWKGLHFYTEEDRDIFFGREREADEFLRLVKRDTLSVLFARSGLGKTSLLRAGVVPQLREQGFFPVLLRVGSLLAAQSAVGQVVDATLVAAAQAEVEVVPEPPAAVSPTSWSGTLWEFFHAHEFWGKRNDLLAPVLIFDQFEEVFTLDRNGTDASEFLEQLADLAEERVPQSLESRLGATGERLPFEAHAQSYKIVLSLREDFVPKLDSLRPLMPAVMRNRFPLEPLNEENAMAVVRRAGGEWVSEEVARQIVAAVAGEGKELRQSAAGGGQGGEIEPAYLSVMCHELFRRMAELGDNKIESDLVAAERGNILAALYQRSFEGLEPKTRVFVEDRLLTASGFRGTVPVMEAEHEGVSGVDLKNLVDRRLLRFEDRLGATHVELSHDLLTRVARKSRAQRREQAAREEERQRQEELRRKLRKARLQTVVWAASAILLLAGIAFYIFGWVKPHQSYGRDCTKRWGTAYPVGELPRAAVAHRSWTLRFNQKGWFGSVQKMDVIDSNHQLSSENPVQTYLSNASAADTQREKESSYEFVYDDNGRIVYEVARDRFGRMTWGFVHAPAIGDKPAKATFLGPDGYPQPQARSQAEFVTIEYDERGFERRLLYHDREGHPMPGPDNAYGEQVEYDDKGRKIRLTSLDARGEPMNNEFGKAGEEAKYDDYGNMVESRAFDAKGEPTLVKGDFHRWEAKYDKWGRQIERRFFNLSNARCFRTDQIGAHRVTWELDDRGNKISTRLYGTNDEPIVAGEQFFEFPAHEERAEFVHKTNRAKTISYFDEEGTPISGPEAWHGYHIEYDKAGFVSAIEVFDTKGEPVTWKSAGVHRWEKLNDAFGQPFEERFFDIKRTPIAMRDEGYHMRKNKYDEAGNLVERSYFDVSGMACEDRSTGAHRIARRFNRFRNPTLTEYFGPNGEPIDSKMGFHRVASEYDEYGSVLGRRWYDKNARACNGPDGVHYVKNKYDKRGLLTEIAQFDVNVQPASDKHGIHQALFEYNEKRQQTRWQYFGLNRAPVEDADGTHLLEMAFDDRGRETRRKQLRADGSPNLDPQLGVATREEVFDKQGNWTEEAFYDARGHLVIGPYGYAKVVLRRHADGSLEEIHIGIEGKPALNTLRGCAIWKVVGGKDGSKIESYYDAEGALMAGPQGYAQVRGRSSDDGTLLEEAFFGPDGSPVAGPDGYHRMERKPGSLLKSAKHFDTSNRELTSIGPDSVVPIIFVAGIHGMRPAAKAGVHVGDVLWRYGSWSFPDAFEEECLKATPGDKILRAVYKKFIAERGRLSGEAAPMVVLRDGRPVQLTMPPLPEKTDGMEVTRRSVPRSVFEDWKKNAAPPSRPSHETM